jgi:hypothetical protein
MGTGRYENLPPTNTVQGELHQILAYVEATNTRLEYLEKVLDSSIMQQVIETQHGLKETHCRLERLQDRIPWVAEISRDIWHNYRRVKALGEKLRWPRDDIVSKGDIGVGGSRGMSTLKIVPIEKDGVYDNQEEVDYEQKYLMSGALPAKYAEGEIDEERYFMSGPLPVKEEAQTHPTLNSISWTTLDEGEARHNACSSLTFVENTPSEANDTEHDYSRPNRAEQDRAVNDTLASPSKRKSVRFAQVTKTPSEVRQSIEEEEAIELVSLHDPDRLREGSASGSSICNGIMFGVHNQTLVIPHLECIKAHEVRDLRDWLIKHKYLDQSMASRISRTEKILQLITLLSKGYRFESVAILFSRTPNEVKSSCEEVFEGLLELHSEIMLPKGDFMGKYLYVHLWRIVGNYVLRQDEETGENYYPWGTEDICKVLITLNLCIGRIRKQGRFALEGPVLNWGKYQGLLED